MLLKIQNLMHIKGDLLQWFEIFWNKPHENVPAQELNEELHKQIIRKFENRKAWSSFIDNIWAVDLADILILFKKSWLGESNWKPNKIWVDKAVKFRRDHSNHGYKIII